MNDPVIDLLQALIRNECVSDGSVSSGHEERSVRTLTDFFGVEGIVVEPAEGRQSLIYRIQGADPTSPSLAFVPHLDVVPANESAWTVDPFSAEIKDGFLYGRGAVDMLNIVASIAVAFKPYLTGEKRARGDLVFCAVADEENGGRFGAHRLVRDHWPLVEASYVLAEVAYPGLVGEHGRSVPVSVGEKGSHFTKLKFSGSSGHGSTPYGADSAAERMVESLQGIIDSRTPRLKTD